MPETASDITLPKLYMDKSVLPAIASKAVSEVTVEDVRAIIWQKKDHGRDAAAGTVHGVLKRMFDCAMTCGIIATNPLSHMPMRHVHRAQSRDRVLSPDEIRQFLQAAMQSNIRRQFKLALHLFLLTLVRKSELFHAKWKDVDFVHAEWHIPMENSKTGKPHIVSYLPRPSPPFVNYIAWQETVSRSCQGVAASQNHSPTTL